MDAERIDERIAQEWPEKYRRALAKDKDTSIVKLREMYAVKQEIDALRDAGASCATCQHAVPVTSEYGDYECLGVKSVSPIICRATVVCRSFKARS